MRTVDGNVPHLPTAIGAKAYVKRSPTLRHLFCSVKSIQIIQLHFSTTNCSQKLQTSYHENL